MTIAIVARNVRNTRAGVICSPDQFLGRFSVVRGIEEVRDFRIVFVILRQVTDAMLFQLRLRLLRRGWRRRRRGWRRPVEEGFLLVLAAFRGRRRL